jgi:hypothetical protein
MSEPDDLRATNAFSGCEALYGSDMATESISMHMAGRAEEQAAAVNISAYDSSIAPFTMKLWDYYDQTVYTQSSATATITVVPVPGQCYGTTGYLSGSSSARFLNGEAVFDSLEVYCQPDAYFNVTVETIYDIAYPFQFYLNPCMQGEIHDKDVCRRCPEGYYSFRPSHDTACLECPEGAFCPGGSDMELDDGYWRQCQTCDDVRSCLTAAACLGGADTDSQCLEGHKGILCE